MPLFYETSRAQMDMKYSAQRSDRLRLSNANGFTLCLTCPVKKPIRNGHAVTFNRLISLTSFVSRRDLTGLARKPRAQEGSS